MKYGWVVVLVVSAACVPRQRPHETMVAAAPRVLRPMALKVGQWATYRERDATGGEVGRLELAAVAAASCGTWVRARLSHGYEERTWMLCIRDDGTPPHDQLARAAVADDDGARFVDVARPGELAAELDALLTRIAPPLLAGTYLREDITVDAGAFSQTLRVDRDGATTWLHPAVPFGGAVKILDGHGREDVLYELGDAGEQAPLEFMHAAQRRPAGTLDIGPDATWYTGTNRRPATHGLTLSVAATFPLTRRFDVAASIRPFVSDSVSMYNAGVGVRWNPLRHGDAFSRTQPYVQVTADYSELVESGNTLGRGIGLSTAVGLSVWSGHDWASALEVDHELAYLNAGHGLTQALSAGWRLRLVWP